MLPQPGARKRAAGSHRVCRPQGEPVGCALDVDGKKGHGEKAIMLLP